MVIASKALCQHSFSDKGTNPEARLPPGLTSHALSYFESIYIIEKLQETKHSWQPAP